MRVLHLYTNYLEICRSLQIIRILLKHVYREWFYSTSAGKRRLRKYPKAQIEAKNTPERLRVAIEELGPTYVKFGQILADRPDVISERFRTELKRLQSNVVPLDDKEAMKLIKNELGSDIEEVFEWFDPKCLASASIGQVYQGRLKSGEEVIVKIQRPHIADKIKLDIYLMRFIARKFMKSYPECACLDMGGFVNEFAEQITKELDYFNEVDNLLRFRRMFENTPDVHIPKPYTEYTTRHLLIMEKIVGVPPDQIETLKANGTDLHKVAVTGANALLKMILEEGFFHADPHPGNIFIEKGNVVCFIDFGMTGVLRPREMNFIADFCISFMRKNPKAMAKSLLVLCGVKHYAQSDELEFKIDTILKKIDTSNLENVNFAGLMQACINILVKHNLRVPSDMFTLAKALVTLQKFAGDLDPQISLTPLIVPYAKNIVGGKYEPLKMLTGLAETVGEYVDFVRDLPVQVSEILYKLKEGKIHHVIKIEDLGPVNRNVRQIGYRVVTAVLLVGLFIGAIQIIVYLPDRKLGPILLGVSLFLIVCTLIGNFFRKMKK